MRKIKEVVIFFCTLIPFLVVAWLIVFLLEKQGNNQYEKRARTKECFIREYFEKSQIKDFYIVYKVDCPK